MTGKQKGIDFLLKTVIALKKIPFAHGLVNQKVFATIGEAGENKMEDKISWPQLISLFHRVLEENKVNMCFYVELELWKTKQAGFPFVHSHEVQPEKGN